jgi:hypothetical protein
LTTLIRRGSGLPRWSFLTVAVLKWANCTKGRLWQCFPGIDRSQSRDFSR